MPTARDLTPEQLARYRAAARSRQQQETEALARREARAWKLAQRAAALLYDRFEVDQVVVFGSLTHPGCFTEWSDLDLAAWGLRPQDSLRAVASVADLGVDIAVNLVDVATCSDALHLVLEREGRPL